MRLFRPSVQDLEERRDWRALVKVLLSDSDVKVREQAGQALARLKDKQSVALLIQALRNPNGYDRAWAARGLGLIGHTDAVPALLQAIKDPYKDTSGNYPVREQAIGALKRMKLSSAEVAAMKPSVEELIDTLSFGPSTARPTAAETLGLVGDKRALGPLIRALDSNDSTLVRAAIVAIGRLGDPPGVEPLIRLLPSFESEVKTAIIGMRTPAVDELVRVLEWRENKTCRFAIEYLGELGDTRCVPKLIPLLREDDLSHRIAAASALGKLKDPQGIQALIVSLEEISVQPARPEDKPSSTKPWGVHAAPVEDISPAGYQRAAIVALGAAGNQVATEVLISQLNNPDATIRAAATTSLGQLRDDRAIKPLVDMARDSSGVVRQAAIHSLSQIGVSGKRAATEAIISQLNHNDDSVRVLVVEYLGQLRDPSTAQLLSDKVKDPSSAVRQSLARALGDVGTIETLPAIRTLLSDSERPVLARAIEAAGKVGSPQLIESLLQVINDLDVELAFLAMDAIDRCGGLPPTQLKRLLKGSSDRLRFYSMAQLISMADPPELTDCEALLLSGAFQLRWGAACLLWMQGHLKDRIPVASALREMSSLPHRHLQRFHRARELLRTGEPRALVSLVDALDDKDPMVRKGATKVLAQLGRIAEPLLAKGLESSSPRLRRRSAETLAAMRQPDSIHEFFTVRRLAPGTVRSLKAALQAEKDRNTAMAIERALQKYSS